MEKLPRSYTQYIDWFLTAKEAQKYVDEHKEKGVTFAIKALPNSIGYEVYKTTCVS